MGEEQFSLVRSNAYETGKHNKDMQTTHHQFVY